MAKIEIEFEITGLKLKVRGEREDASRAAQAIGQQLSSVMNGPGAVIDGEIVTPKAALPAPTAAPKPARRRGVRGSGNGAAEGPQPVTWIHDPKRWGMPSQDWSNGNKILWTMYIIKESAGTKELTGSVIAKSFNLAFKQFGLLRNNHMPRDLGALKTKSTPLVLDDAAKVPIQWFLTDAGIREAERLIEQSKQAAQQVTT